MKQKLFSVVSLLLAALAAGTFLTSCGGESETQTGAENTVPAGENETQPETEPEPEHIFPEKDMAQTEITILTEDWAAYDPIAMDDILTDSANGEVLNDAVFDRMRSVSELYNCRLAQADLTSDEGKNALLKSVRAGDDAYQIALIRSCQYSTMLSEHSMLALDSVPNVDLSAPWYDGNSLAALALLGKNYGVVSNVTMNRYELTFCGYFNKVMAENLQLGSIYDIVRDGKWTWDAMFSLGKTAVQDLDNDGEATTADCFGITYINDIPEGLLNAGGVRYAELDGEGIPTMTCGKEENITKMQALFELFSDKNISINIHQRSKQAYIDEVGLFMNRQALFSLGGVYYAPQYRDMKDDFGIVPLPKYSEEQEYAAPLFGNVFPITILPVTNADTENAGLILDAMSYEGWHSVLPAFYDIVLQGKLARDEDSNYMLDLIFNNTFYDTGLLFQFGGVVQTIRNIYQPLKGDFVSSLEKTSPKMEKDIEKLISSIEDAE